jgi:hypothetical protein
VQQRLNKDLSGDRVLGFDEKALAAAVIDEERASGTAGVDWWQWQETPVIHGVPPPNCSP